MADSELRQRKPVASKASKASKAKADPEDDDTSYSPWVDVLRVISFIVVASCGLSYFITDGKSFVWGGVSRPDVLRLAWWEEQLRGPVYMTPEELSAYSGTDPDKPVYLSINGTIYDVSAGRHIYGPGGSYSFFAGKDASRAYVTGCFADDLTQDMRGVEEMYLPLDDPETDAHWTTAEIEKLRADERASAEDRAFKALKHWVDFFAKSKKYHRVGYLQREEGWLEKEPRRELCPSAKKGRAKRKIPKA